MQRLEFAVVAAFLFLFSAPHGFAAEAPAGPVAAVTLAIDKPLHFDGADGKDVTLAPGDYLVLPEQAGLRLIDVTDAVFLVKATAATHEQKIEQSQALVVAVGDDERHIVLLQPDGQRLDAAGTVSGIHSRGLGSPLVSNTALQNAVTMNETARAIAVRNARS